MRLGNEGISERTIEMTTPSVSSDGPMLIDLAAVQSEYIPVSRTKIWRMVQAGTLPRPIKLAKGRGGRLLWRRDAIEAAIHSLETECVA